MIPTIVTEITYEDWLEKYKPKSVNGELIDYWKPGPDNIDELKQWEKANKLWTAVDANDGFLIVNGYHFVNRLAYYVTDVPYDEGHHIEVWDEEEEEEKLDPKEIKYIYARNACWVRYEIPHGVNPVFILEELNKGASAMTLWDNGKLHRDELYSVWETMEEQDGAEDLEIKTHDGRTYDPFTGEEI